MTGKVVQLFPGAGVPPDPPLDRLISEAEVLFYRPTLGPGLLLAARKAELIAWTPGKRHSAWYTLADVDAYLETRKKPCRAQKPDPSLNSGDNGSPKNPDAKDFTASGMTPELVEHVALASAQEILKKPKSA